MTERPKGGSGHGRDPATNILHQGRILVQDICLVEHGDEGVEEVCEQLAEGFRTLGSRDEGILCDAFLVKVNNERLVKSRNGESKGEYPQLAS